MGLFDGMRKALTVASENIQKDKDEKFIKETILEKMDIANIKLLCKRNNLRRNSPAARK